MAASYDSGVYRAETPATNKVAARPIVKSIYADSFGAAPVYAP
jgi:hypothetical protein